ncbi:hypothetical protein KSS87_020412 [Heliosperma pusillum]|nr:hypothetical protein KSS87_020412 [Heliosperma pusillum]
MVTLKIKSSSPSKSSPSQRKAGRKLKAEKEVPMSTHSQSKTIIKAVRKVNTEGNRKVKPEEDLLRPIDESKKADVKSSQIRVPSDFTKRCRPSSHTAIISVTGLACSSLSDGESLKSLWRERYNIVSSKDPIPLSAVNNKLVGNGLTDEEFKETFVLFAMSSFLAPVSGAVVDLRLLSVVEHTYTSSAANILGCIVLLDIVYFHRLKREDAVGGLGHSDRSDVVFLISRKHSSESGEASSLLNNHVGNVRHIVVDLPADIRTDEEVHSSSIDDSSQVSPSAASQETGTVDDVGTEQLVATPSFFTSQVIKKVDEYVNEVLTMRESRVIRPIVPKKAKDVIIQPPSFDLFSQFYNDCVKLSDVDQDSVEKEKAPQSPLIEDYVKEHTIEESPISLEDILSNVFSDVEVHEKEAANTKGCVYDKGVDVEDGKDDANAGGKEDGKEVEKDDVKGDANVYGKEDDILVDEYLVDVAGGNDFFDGCDSVGAEMVKDDKETKTFTDLSAHEQDHDG